MALLRRVIGDALRARRQGLHRTLREVSIAANVSLGYLSEIERGQKEASSELLASICEALGSQLSEVLREASDTLAQTEHAGAALGDTRLPERPLPEPALPAESEIAEQPMADTPSPLPAARTAPVGSFAAAGPETVTDGKVSVSVHRDGPLRTRLHAVRTRRGKPVGSAG